MKPMTEPEMMLNGTTEKSTNVGMLVMYGLTLLQMSMIASQFMP